MKFGVMFANVGPMAFAKGAIGIAQAAEEAGIESLWTVEHTVVPAGYQSAYPYSDSGRMPGPEDSPIPDPLIWLAYVPPPPHHPAGHRHPDPPAAQPHHPRQGGGHPRPALRWAGGARRGRRLARRGVRRHRRPLRDRGRRTDEHIEALRALWSQSPATHQGGWSSFNDVYSRPGPAESTIPIHIGGHSKPAARRAGRLGDGFFPGRGAHEDLAELIDVMRQAATDAGRNPDDIEITSGGNGALGSGALDEIKQLADLGVSRVIIPPLAFDVEGQRTAFAKYAEDVISRC